MLSSVQIAQIMQQQNAQFMGAAQHAQTISQQMPQPYGGGLGAFGGGGNSGPTFQQIPLSGNNQRAGFNYGMPYAMGYGPGNDVASRFMSAGGGAASMGIGVASAIAGMGSLPVGIGAAVVGGMGKHVIGSMVGGAQEQSNVNRVLGQMQFQNPASRTGRGFSRQDASMIGETIREMQHLPEAMTSMGELTRIMDKVIQTGQMNGVRDPHEFQRKFKATVRTLKEVAQVMGTTMEEAVPLLQEARQAGHYGQAGTKSFMFQRQMTQGLTGMNQQQVNQTAQAGAQMGFATGGSRATGSKHAIRATNQIGMMNRLGIISNDEIAELTGEEGEKGIQQMGMNLTEMAYRQRGSVIGTVMTVGLGEMKGGKFTGKMDQEMVKRLRTGTLDWGELKSQMHRNIATRGAKISYVAKRGQMFSEMAGEAGAEGLALMLKQAIGNRIGSDENIFNIVQQEFGANEREAAQMTTLLKSLPKLTRERMISEDTEVTRQSKVKQMNRMSPDAIKRRISKQIENAVTEPFKEWGVSMHKAVQSRVDEFIDDLSGQYHSELSAVSVKLQTDVARGKTKSSTLSLTKGIEAGPLDLARGAAIKSPGSMASTISALAMAIPTGFMSLGRVSAAGLSDLAGVGVRALSHITGEKPMGVRIADEAETWGMKLTKNVGEGGAYLDSSLRGEKRGLTKKQLSALSAGMESLETGEEGKAHAKYLQRLNPQLFEHGKKKLNMLMASDDYQQISDPLERRKWLEHRMGDDLEGYRTQRASIVLDTLANVTGHGAAVGLSNVFKGWTGPAADLRTASMRRKHAEEAVVEQGKKSFGIAGLGESFAHEMKSGSDLSLAMMTKVEGGKRVLKTEQETSDAANVLAETGRLAAAALGKDSNSPEHKALEAYHGKNADLLKTAGILSPKDLADGEKVRKLQQTAQAGQDKDMANKGKILMATSTDEGRKQAEKVLKEREDTMAARLAHGPLARLGLEKGKDPKIKQALDILSRYGSGGGGKTVDEKIAGSGQAAEDLYSFLDNLGSSKKDRNLKATLLAEGGAAGSGYGVYRAESERAEKFFKKKAKKGESYTLGDAGIVAGDVGMSGTEKFGSFKEMQAALRKSTSHEVGLRAGGGTEGAVSEKQVAQDLMAFFKTQTEVNNATKCALGNLINKAAGAPAAGAPAQ